MIVAGCDVGSLTAKVVLLGDGRILSSSIVRAKSKPEDSAREVMDIALKEAGIKINDINYCVGTGYGRKKVSFVDCSISEIACHGKGSLWLLPTVRTVIDIGGQDCKVVKIDQAGNIVKFVTNDKCAAGTGRFLEVMANILEVKLEELGRLSSLGKKTVKLASTCTVWAQAEVVSKLNDGESIADIGAAVNQAMASRVGILANSVGLERDVCMSGGVAKNRGVFQELEKLLGVRIKRPRIDPQLIGALGAAVYAIEKGKGGR